MPRKLTVSERRKMSSRIHEMDIFNAIRETLDKTDVPTLIADSMGRIHLTHYIRDAIARVIEGQ